MKGNKKRELLEEHIKQTFVPAGIIDSADDTFVSAIVDKDNPKEGYIAVSFIFGENRLDAFMKPMAAEKFAMQIIEKNKLFQGEN